MIRFGHHIGMGGWIFITLVLCVGGVSGAITTETGDDDPVTMSIKGITLEEDNPGECRVVIWASRPISDYQLACLKSPSRLVVHLPGSWDKLGKRNYPIENDTIRRASIRKTAEGLDAVLYLKTRYHLAPYVEKSIKGLTLRLKKRHLYAIDPLGAPDASVGAYGKKAAGTVEIRQAETLTGFELVITADRPLGKYRSFTLMDETPAKLAVDLLGSWQYPGASTMETDSDLVERVRVGEHDEFLRVVLDLNITSPPAYGIEETDEGLVLMVTRRPSADEIPE